MTIKNLYPPNRPVSIYNVINGRPELPVISTFSRSTKATYIDATGKIVTAGIDEPRFDFDPKTQELKGLLLEEKGSNCLYNTNIGGGGTWVNATLGTGDDILGLPCTLTSWLNNNDGQYCQAGTQFNGGPYYGSMYIDLKQSTTTKVVQSMGIFRGAFGSVSVNFKIRDNVDGTKRCEFDQLIPQSGWSNPSWSIQDCGDQVFRIGVGGTTPNGNQATRLYLSQSEGNGVVATAGQMLDTDSVGISSYLETTSTSRVERSKDAFSLTTSNNFDGGFSLLLDSETTTDDFIYKIKASGAEVASLNNDNGTLDWQIGNPPTSAKIQGSYPQVGFVTGRVRTISSFTAAGDAVNPNYLYTKGLSFPTVGAPAAGANELEFGIPQTLKAVYIWNGQLDPVQAVSIIKGDTNIVPNIPIAVSYTHLTLPTILLV